jgi:hypothetical protein
MSGTVSTTTEVILVDSRIRSGTVTLPLSSEIPYRILSVKDAYGNANVSSRGDCGKFASASATDASSAMRLSVLFRTSNFSLSIMACDT